MIILDILQNILEIFPHLILGAGVSIFGGIGSGSQSGKLTFKKLFGGTNINCSDFGINLDATSQVITLSDTTPSSGTPPIIGSFVIAVGTGTTITDSFLCVVNSAQKCAINGALGINTTGNYIFNNSSSMILGGYNGSINCSNRSAVLGGCFNSINTALYNEDKVTNCDNLITSGSRNIICSSRDGSAYYRDTSIVGGSYNTTVCSSNSAILNGCRNCICCVGGYGGRGDIFTSPTIIQGAENYMDYQDASNSRGPRLIINGCNNFLSYPNSFIDNGKKNKLIGKYSSIINGRYGCIGSVSKGTIPSDFSTIINGLSNKIINSNRDYSCLKAVIINGESNWICLRNSIGSSILNGNGNKLCGGIYSTIINGSANKIDAGLYNGVNSLHKTNSIINGRSNKIYYKNNIGLLLDSPYSTVCNSTIVNGFGSSLISTKYGVILNGVSNSITYGDYNSIIGNRANCIVGAGGFGGNYIGQVSSVIIGSFANIISGDGWSNNSVIIGRSENNISGSQNNVIIGLCSNCITKNVIGDDQSRYNAIVGGFSNTIYNSGCANSIVGSNLSCMTDSFGVSDTRHSNITASCCSCIKTYSCTSAIIGSQCSSICCASMSVIINSQKANIVSNSSRICNSALVSISGATLSSSNLVCTNIVKIFGSMSVMTSIGSTKCNGLALCSVGIGSCICRIIAVNGIITCIGTC